MSTAFVLLPLKVTAAHHHHHHHLLLHTNPKHQINSVTLLVSVGPVQTLINTHTLPSACPQPRLPRRQLRGGPHLITTDRAER